MNYFHKFVEANLIGRDWTCGDIHGCYTQFLTELAQTDFDKTTDRLFFSGDICDRGKESFDALKLYDQPWFFSVLGNHELFCIQGLENDWMAQNHERPNNGGAWFYKLSEITQYCIAERFKQLPVAISTFVDGYKIGFVHADCFNDWDDVENADYTEDQKQFGRSPADFLVWSRDRAESTKPPVLVKNIEHVFLGHTVMLKPTTLGNCTFIDTGPVFGGKFTFICINDFLKEKHAKSL